MQYIFNNNYVLTFDLFYLVFKSNSTIFLSILPINILAFVRYTCNL